MLAGMQLAPRAWVYRPPVAAAAAAATGGCRQVTCMAHPRRVSKVARQIEREVGQLLLSDKVVQQAVSPGRSGNTSTLSALASVTEVRLTNDLQVAKVYLSVYSDEAGKAAAMQNLQRLEGYVRKHVGKQIRLRLTPEIRFVVDESMEATERIYKLLEQVKRISSGDAEPPPVTILDEGEDDDDDDDDELDADDDQDDDDFDWLAAKGTRVI